MPARQLARAELDHVRHQPHRRLGREDPLLLRDVLLEDVVLDRPAQRGSLDALLLGHADVEREQHRRRAVDRHRGRDLAERDPVEQRLRVGERVDRHALAPDLAERAGVVGVVAHQRRHVEGRREAGLPVLEQVAEALVRLLGRAEAGELPHRPEPAAVHRRVDAARERIGARVAEVAVVVELDALRRVERFVLEPGDRAEELALPFGRGLVELALPLVVPAELALVLGRRHPGIVPVSGGRAGSAPRIERARSPGRGIYAAQLVRSKAENPGPRGVRCRFMRWRANALFPSQPRESTEHRPQAGAALRAVRGRGAAGSGTGDRVARQQRGRRAARSARSRARPHASSPRT